jgi:predicted Zn-dependent protease
MVFQRRRRAVAALLSALLLPLLSCAVNPATGQREFSLISESQEIRIGQEADQEITSGFGEYGDDALARYVGEIGSRLAAVSERPALPWSFRVLDDPVVNAFALPGGYLFVTRGILAHLGSEAELAGVLGHEIGHVTAKHSVSQMSRQQLQQIGLGVGMVLSEDIASVGGLLQAGLGLLNLKYGRDDETQSDELGVRYMSRTGYDPHALVEVFRTLSLVSGGAGGRLPQWQSTHPYPENRETHIEEVIEATGQDFSSAGIGSERYLRRLDGLVFGDDPRQGYFSGSTFHHPELRFRLVFPEGWTTLNRRDEVLAVAEDERTVLGLTLASGTDAGLAFDDFAGQEGVRVGQARRTTVNGLPTVRAEFRADTQDGALSGEVTFVELSGRLYRLIGYGTTDGWRASAGSVAATMSSFSEEADPDVLGVQPWRIEIVSLPRAMSGADFLDAYPSIASEGDVLRINRIERTSRLERGEILKRVVGQAFP